jgi:hypothetical protein
MVDMSTRMAARGKDQAPEHQRNQNRQRRLQVLKDARPQHATVRVVPTDEKYRPVLKHQPSGIAFRKEGAAEWPNDRFTQRRLRDGSVKLEETKEDKPAAKPAPTPTPTPSA